MRARNIKPSTFANEILGEADPLLTILFAGLWCMADREGRLEDRPLKIKGEILRYREGIDINGYLTELQRLGFIRRYSVAGKNYIQVVNFAKHQNPHHTEKASEIPEEIIKLGSPIETEVKQPLNNGETPADSGFLIPDPLIPELSVEPHGSPLPVIGLPLNDGSEFKITTAHVIEWATLYPAVDVMQELRSMRGWLLANPENKKTKRGILKFVNRWLSKQQDRGKNGQTNHTPKPNAFDRSKEKLREWERQQSAPVIVDGQVVGAND